MKNFFSISILFVAAATLFSCKKSDDGVNPSEEFKGSVWAGEFKITSATYKGLQPGSLILNGNGGFTWHDLSGDVTGIWMMEGNKVTLNYSSGTTVTADVSKESWSNFSTTINKSFEIINLSRTAIPKPEELNTTSWKGYYPISGGEETLNFMPEQKVRVSGTTLPYSISGAGIRYTKGSPVGPIKTYAVFINGTSMKGCDEGAFSPDIKNLLWEGKKQ